MNHDRNIFRRTQNQLLIEEKWHRKSVVCLICFAARSSRMSSSLTDSNSMVLYRKLVCYTLVYKLAYLAVHVQLLVGIVTLNCLSSPHILHSTCSTQGNSWPSMSTKLCSLLTDPYEIHRECPYSPKSACLVTVWL